MVSIIEKKNIHDTKMGRWSRVLGEEKKEKIVGRGKKKSREEQQDQKKKEDSGHIQWPCGRSASLKIYLVPYQEVPICEVGQGDHPTAMEQPEISSDGPPHLARGGGGIYHQLV